MPVHPDNQIFTQFVKKFPVCKATGGSLPCSQQPVLSKYIILKMY